MTGASPPQKLDMNAVWARAMVLVRDNMQLLGVLAGVFVLLPSAFLNLALPPQETLQGPMEVLLEPTSSEEAMQRAAEAIGASMAPFMVWAGLVQVIQNTGYASMMALVGRNRPTVGRAIIIALKAILPIMVAFLIYFAAIYALMILLPLALAPLGAAMGAFLGAMIGLVATLFITTRLTLTMPAVVVDGEMNPLKALLRSWRLTSASKGNVFGFWMLLIVAYFVIFVLVSAVIGLLAAIAGDGAGATLISGILGGVFAAISGIVICTVAVAMHAQLSGSTSDEIATKFG